MWAEAVLGVVLCGWPSASADSSSHSSRNPRSLGNGQLSRALWGAQVVSSPHLNPEPTLWGIC